MRGRRCIENISEELYEMLELLLAIQTVDAAAFELRVGEVETFAEGSVQARDDMLLTSDHRFLRAAETGSCQKRQQRRGSRLEAADQRASCDSCATVHDWSHADEFGESFSRGSGCKSCSMSHGVPPL